ncbi:MAG: glycosyl hydrolase [Acidobacteria bacterium]|nr:glycosyl hydrolase [Acidobacteriota bacterium]
MLQSPITRFALAAALLSAPVAAAQESPAITEDLLSGLKLRGIGPAARSGRVADVTIDPNDRATWYVAVASGNAFKTTNRGTTWEPIFENYPVYSTSTIVIDPKNSNVLWLGTGENNGQRSVGYGNGVWRSRDAGASFEHLGLDESEHIGNIVIDPRDSDTVYVAAQGPLWRAGGDRGLYKTTDGGATWERVLHISEDTGISQVAMDPRNPDVLYASSWQRRRHTGLLVAGGPEGGIHKSEDGGATWRQLSKGLPSPDRHDIGRIGLAISPHNPDVVYALIAASDDASGFYRSTDRGESWEKRSDYICVDPQYYMEIFPDPHRPGRIYSMDVWTHVTDDDGATWRQVNSRWKHVDNHDLEFDPDDPDYLMMSSDGGIYESWDLGERWKFHANQSLTQFYRVGIDNDFPFYNVYGGTQDNATLGGPSRTTSIHGILNSDWLDVIGGDGFQARVDPDDPNIVYAQYQYAGIARFDKRTGERTEIQPQPEPDDPPLKWNWDAPLIISPHNGQRLYFGANRLYRSDDRANTWVPISEDLTRGIDRSTRTVMGRTWSTDAVWRNVFTSTYGNMVALDESPLVEGLLYTGMDDGRVQITGDGGLEWRAVDTVPGVPPRTYVADLHASRHRENTVFAVFNNHKEGDFRPYVMRSDDRGVSWEDITGDLPEDQLAWSVVEDPGQEGLLFLGTEFGLFTTLDGGDHWVRLKGGLPTIAIRDLEIQPRENDLVLASFGRGFFILDDYTPLRHLSAEALAAEGAVFPVKDPWMYVEANPLGGGEKSQRGDAFYTAPNPPFGAVVSYHLKEGALSVREQRRERERAQAAAGEALPYPGWDELRAEDRAEDPAVFVVIRNSEGNVVRRISAPKTAGIHRVAWDLRYPDPERGPVGYWSQRAGPLAMPGTYTAELVRRDENGATRLGEPQSFTPKVLAAAGAPPADAEARHAFQREVANLQRRVFGAVSALRASIERVEALAAAIDESGAEGDLRGQASAIRAGLMDVRVRFLGDDTVSSRREAVLPGIRDRIQRVVGAFWSTADPTNTHRRQVEIVREQFGPANAELVELVEVQLAGLEAQADAAGVPWTPGRRIPR